MGSELTIQRQDASEIWLLGFTNCRLSYQRDLPAELSAARADAWDLHFSAHACAPAICQASRLLPVRDLTVHPGRSSIAYFHFALSM